MKKFDEEYGYTVHTIFRCILDRFAAISELRKEKEISSYAAEEIEKTWSLFSHLFDLIPENLFEDLDSLICTLTKED